MAVKENHAPPSPGIPPRWTSSAKTGIGTSLSNESRVWFTLSHGIFNEIYYPRIDQACIRDMGLVVTDGAAFFSEEKRDTLHQVTWMADGVPAFALNNSCSDGHYRIEKEIVTDPKRQTVLQKTRFIPQTGALENYHLYVLLAPHLQNHGTDNTAWVGDYNGIPMLFAQRNGCALALACSSPWLKRSVGYVGFSDGWQDLKANGQMTWEYTRAENGNVAEIGEIDLSHAKGEFTLALGFGNTPDEAAASALGSLGEDFDAIKKNYISGWQEWHTAHQFLNESSVESRCLVRKSLAVISTHESKQVPGAFIASLAIPWGFNKGDEDQGGYHLVWPRDMVQTAGGLLAAGAHDDVRRILTFFEGTQQPDGHWPQNMWLDGTPYWDGIQMDETALPILLVDLSWREKALTRDDLTALWPMVKKAAGYLVRNGPVSPQDRWEEDPGYTPYTIATEIAALLAAADIADLNGETALATYLRETADTWNDCIDRWMYMVFDDWGKKYTVDGYYVRISPELEETEEPPREPTVTIRNVLEAENSLRANQLVSPDALALVRFGLRSPNDPRILNTVKIIDDLLKTDTPLGPVWHRYNQDGYGEHKDGSPFDGIGIGRGWPLLTGERGHYELAAGDQQAARQLLAAMEHFANESGFIPEQIWDSADLPEHELFLGHPSGSAMPLVWAHAEYLKLHRSLRDGKIFDCPPQTVQRYLTENTVSACMLWRFNNKLRVLIPGKVLRIELTAAASIRWTDDDWQSFQDINTCDTGLGTHYADLPAKDLTKGRNIAFTFHWTLVGNWEGKNFIVPVSL